MCALLPEGNPGKPECTKHSAKGSDGKLSFPERYVQNVHGYFTLNNDYPTIMNLNYSWDGTTLVDQTVNLYCIDTSTGQPMSGQPTLNFPHPTSDIPADFDVKLN